MVIVYTAVWLYGQTSPAFPIPYESVDSLRGETEQAAVSDRKWKPTMLSVEPTRRAAKTRRSRVDVEKLVGSRSVPVLAPARKRLETEPHLPANAFKIAEERGSVLESDFCHEVLEVADKRAEGRVHGASPAGLPPPWRARSARSPGSARPLALSSPPCAGCSPTCAPSSTFPLGRPGG
jgi:hypothetical protein